MALEVTGDQLFLLELITVIVESVIAVLLYKTVRDYAEVAKLSRIEAKHRFRPWVGPEGGISFLREEKGKHHFSITIKNFGEIPASSVIGMSASGAEPFTRALVTKDRLANFNLGPLLPYMEKRYWIFVDSQLIEDAKKRNGSVNVAIYFLYEFPSGAKSGYGMISELDPKSNSFVHKDMWVDQEIA